MVVALIALFVSLGGSAYAVATIGSDDIIDGSIRNRDFKDGTLRGKEAKLNSFGANAVKESSLDAAQFRQVPSSVVTDGVTRHGVVSNVGALVRGRGITGSSQSGPGQYVVIFDRDVRGCTYFATLGDESAAGPGNGQVSVTSAAANVNGVRVVTRDSAGEFANRSFHLLVNC